VKLYIGIVCVLVGRVVHCEFIYWDFVWFDGTGRALCMYIVGLRLVRWNR